MLRMKAKISESLLVLEQMLCLEPVVLKQESVWYRVCVSENCLFSWIAILLDRMKKCLSHAFENTSAGFLSVLSYFFRASCLLFKQILLSVFLLLGNTMMMFMDTRDSFYLQANWLISKNSFA